MPLETKPCLGCNEMMVEVRPNRKTCSSKCRSRVLRVAKGLAVREKLPDGVKRCPSCRELLSTDSFYQLTMGPRAGRFSSSCKECTSKKAKGVRRDAPRDPNVRRGVSAPIGYTYQHRGYILEKVGVGAHHRVDRYGYVFQHILAAEKKYGMDITRDFTVHHKNGVRHDNRPENLELRVGLHGKGANAIEGILAQPYLRRQVIEQLVAMGYKVTGGVL